MACKICRRYDCTESFHSIEEQLEYENLEAKARELTESEVENENSNT